MTDNDLLLLNLVFVVADQRFATLIRILGIKPRDEGEAEHSGPKLGKEADVLYGSFKRVLSRILLENLAMAVAPVRPTCFVCA
jgi:hypothetical protein